MGGGLTIHTARRTNVARIQNGETVAEIIDFGDAGRPVLIADRELYANDDRSKLIEVGEEGAAFLIASHPGKPIPADVVEEMGLYVNAKGEVKQRAKGGNKERRAGGNK